MRVAGSRLRGKNLGGCIILDAWVVGTLSGDELNSLASSLLCLVSCLHTVASKVEKTKPNTSSHWSLYLQHHPLSEMGRTTGHVDRSGTSLGQVQDRIQICLKRVNAYSFATPASEASASESSSSSASTEWGSTRDECDTPQR